MIPTAGCLAAMLWWGLFPAQEIPDLTEVMRREILAPSTTMQEAQDRVERRVLSLPTFGSAAEWEKFAARLRSDVLEKIVYRGEAARWKDLPLQVEWGPDLAGAKGYRLRKLRYEAVPGLWIPALLYLPDPVSGKVPVHMAVSGH